MKSCSECGKEFKHTDWCPYSAWLKRTLNQVIDELEEKLSKAEDFVTYCMGLDMPEGIRKKAKDYFNNKQETK